MTAAARLAILLVRAYQLLLSPFLGGACRFVPSCSAYAIEAIATHGAVRGAWLALRRRRPLPPVRAGGPRSRPSRFGNRKWNAAFSSLSSCRSRPLRVPGALSSRRRAAPGRGRNVAPAPPVRRPRQPVDRRSQPTPAAAPADAAAVDPAARDIVVENADVHAVFTTQGRNAQELASEAISRMRPDSRWSCAGARAGGRAAPVHARDRRSERLREPRGGLLHEPARTA